MGLIKRMSALVTANLNDLVDQCENPEKMLKAAVRDMETALGRLMDSAARAIAHHRLLGRQLSSEREAIARRLTLAEAAVARGDDEAARRELRHKAEHQRLADVLAQQVERADALGQRLRNQVTAMRIKLAEARRKLVDISARSRAATAQRQFARHMPDATCAGVTATDFESMCARVEQSEAETDALLELIGESDATEPLDTEIEAELRALKEAASHAAR
jgi:phage shock protein A